MYIYNHPENIQRLNRFPPIAAFISFGGESWGMFSSLYILYDALLNLPSKFDLQIYKLLFKPGRALFSHIGGSYLGSPLNDLNAALSWDHWTNSWGWHKDNILHQKNHVPVPPKKNKSQQKKVPRCSNRCALLFHTDNKATEKERALTSFSPLWPNWLSTHRTTVGFMENTEVLPQSVVLHHFSPLCG